MQDNIKIEIFKQAIGRVFNKLRTSNNISVNKLGLEYDINKGNISRIENGSYDCHLSTAWKLAEANGIKFSEFAKLLENELGESFTFVDV